MKTNTSFRASFAAIPLALGLCAVMQPAQAAIVDYTMTGTLSGTYGGNGFTNQLVTIKLSADSSSIGSISAPGTGSGTTPALGATISIGSLVTNAALNVALGAGGWASAFPIGNVAGFYTSTGQAVWSVVTGALYNPALSGSFSGSFPQAFFGGLSGNAGSTAFVIGSQPPIGEVTFNAAAAVPEPETYALLGMGALALAWARRRQKAAKGDQAVAGSAMQAA